MKNIIYKLFGIPYKKSQVFTFFYWIVVAMYLPALILFSVSAIVFKDNEYWFSFFLGLIVYPILFRVVYGINVKIQRAFRGDK